MLTLLARNLTLFKVRRKKGTQVPQIPGPDPPQWPLPEPDPIRKNMDLDPGSTKTMQEKKKKVNFKCFYYLKMPFPNFSEIKQVYNSINHNKGIVKIIIEKQSFDPIQ